MRHRRVVVGTLAAALIIGGVGAWFWSGMAVRAYRPENLMRFHVIAHSDAAEDQQLKLKVRDAVVEDMTPRLQGVQGVAEAREKVGENLAHIQDVAAQTVAEAGQNYPVRVYHGHFVFPECRYGSLKLPAGTYEAVRVVIGDGQGHNWWCVLFPPLCFVSARQETVPATTTPSPPVEVEIRFKILDYWEHFTGR